MHGQQGATGGKQSDIFMKKGKVCQDSHSFCLKFSKCINFYFFSVTNNEIIKSLMTEDPVQCFYWIEDIQ